MPSPPGVSGTSHAGPSPGRGRRPIVVATTADGLKLPVIDVTHPAFAVADDPASLAARHYAFLVWDRRNRRMPSIITRLLMRLAARRSPLLRRILAWDDEYLDSVSTYMLKLGVDHLPPGFDGPVDRKVAAAPHVALIRLRMQQIARLLAEALVAPLADAPAAPLHLVNIAGGPALDSINALIILARAHATLIHRPIAIHVFDAHEDGPTFGARASCALRARRAAAGARGPIPVPPLRLERHRPARAPGRRPRRAWRHHRGLVGGVLLRPRATPTCGPPA
jgi:hypothetical protein